MTTETAKKAPAKKAPAAKKVEAPAEPKAPRGGQHDEAVLAVLKKHHKDEGLTIAEVAELSKLRGRVVTNVLWRLETKLGKAQQVGTTRTKRYVAVK